LGRVEAVPLFARFPGETLIVVNPLTGWAEFLRKSASPVKAFQQKTGADVRRLELFLI
jgi:hypothetical protein